jgi:hypothetical protein
MKIGWTTSLQGGVMVTVAIGFEKSERASLHGLEMG